MNSRNLLPPPVGDNFADRIRYLIQRVGSATEIARKCGFSEGVVRSWRDGNTDPSRARCVTLARTLGISLVWLVAGEGTPQIDPSQDDPYSSAKVTTPRLRHDNAHKHIISPDEQGIGATVDAQRLNTAVRILQTELSLADNPLSLLENADLLIQLYGMLGTGASPVDSRAMATLTHQLAQRVRKEDRNA